MKIVRRRADNVVLYVRPETERVEIREDGLWFGRARALDINSTDHEVIEGVPLPQWFIGGLMAWDGQWSIPDQAAYDAALSQNPAYIAEKEVEAEKLSSKRVLREQMAAKLNDLPDDELDTVTYLYEEWSGEGLAVEVDELQRRNGKLWRALQAHTTQPEWPPEAVPALWARVRESGTEWFAGEQVEVGTVRTYQGTSYTALQAHTTQLGWEPPSVPSLWEVA